MRVTSLLFLQRRGEEGDESRVCKNKDLSFKYQSQKRIGEKEKRNVEPQIRRKQDNALRGEEKG